MSSVGAAEGTALNNRATTSKAVDYCWLTWHTSWIIVCLCVSSFLWVLCISVKVYAQVS